MKGDALKPRITLLVTEMLSRGGIQRYMQDLQAACEQYFQDVRIVSLNDGACENADHNVSFIGAARSKLKFIKAAWRVAGNDATVVIGHVALLPVALALRLTGKTQRIVLVLHGIEAWQRLPWWCRLGLFSVRRTVATTKYTADKFSALNGLPKSGMRVVPLCVAKGPSGSTMQRFLIGDFPLLCVARQSASERYKGFESIFEALRILGDSVLGLHLNLVGSGDDQARLRALALALGVDRKVTFWGSLDDDSLQAAYRDCATFVMPSRAEGFGIVYLEAMWHQKPCIGGRHGGVPEVIIDGVTGFLVEHNDSRRLAERILELASDSTLRMRLSTAAGQRARLEFSFQRFAGSWRDLLL